MGEGFLTIRYFSTTVGYCFPYCFLETFVGGKAVMEGDKVQIGGGGGEGVPSVHPTR